MKAITVKFHGPTKTRGSRYVASAEGVKSVSVSRDFGADDAREAARTLAIKYEWTGNYMGGTLPDGRAVFVNAGTHSAPIPGEAFHVLKGDIEMTRGMGLVPDAEKPTHEWIVQGYYGSGSGWEDLTHCESRAEAKASLRDYNVNETKYSHRIVRRELGSK